MDKEFEININDKKAVKYLKILIITLLAVIEIIVCAQYIEMYAQNGDIARLAAVVICSAILTTLVAVDSFIKSSFRRGKKTPVYLYTQRREWQWEKYVG